MYYITGEYIYVQKKQEHETRHYTMMGYGLYPPLEKTT